MSVLAFDTSNYTTSIAYFDGIDGVNCSRLLPVKQGELGLRQSDAVFHHTRQLPELLDSLAGCFLILTRQASPPLVSVPVQEPLKAVICRVLWLDTPTQNCFLKACQCLLWSFHTRRVMLLRRCGAQEDWIF